jgi:nitroreductase
MHNKSIAILQAMRERRSVRRFTDAPVSREDILSILEAGRWAPSGRNGQPWRFLALLPDDPRTPAVAACSKYTAMLLSARALIAVVLDKGAMYHALKDHQGAGACLQNMLLAAHGLGLGAVWVGEILAGEAKVFEALNLDKDRFELMAVLAVGHPAGPAAPLEGSRRPLSELLLEEF